MKCKLADTSTAHNLKGNLYRQGKRSSMEVAIMMEEKIIKGFFLMCLKHNSQHLIRVSARAEPKQKRN